MGHHDRVARPVTRWLCRCGLGSLAWLLPAPAPLGASEPSEPSEPEAEVGTLQVRAIEGARVEIDGVSRGEVPVSVDVPAGEHTLEVTALGHHPWQATITIGSGATVTMATQLVACEAGLEPERRREPGAHGVFLAVEPKSVFLTTTGAHATASVLLPRSEPTGSSALLEPNTPHHDAEVFLAVEPERIFLPSRTSVKDDVFLPEPPPSLGEVFLPLENGTRAVRRAP